MSLAVVIPVLDEEQTLPLLLEDLRALKRSTPLDVVVSDAGSQDGSVLCAITAGARIVQAPRGRARQLNAGARASDGEWLLFLHADSRLDEQARGVLAGALREPVPFEAAVFRFAVDLPRIWKNLLERGQALREALWGVPYGDQGLLIRRDTFEAIGGYPDVALMEDVAIIQVLRRRGKVKRLPAAIVTSGRRYRQYGVLRTSVQHLVLVSLYFLGVPPTRLARWRL
jgi:rSAM/selenodomain-associated transferase 2